MSRREATIKALSGALTPKGHDLSQYRRRGIHDREIKVRADDAAGALAFAAKDRELTTYTGIVQTYGDDLATILIRLKYVDQRSRPLLGLAQDILLERHGGLARRVPSETMAVVALVAIFEWLHDACPKCRARRAGAATPLPCLACGQKRVKIDTVSDGSCFEIIGQPSTDCAKCKGLGRIFSAEKKGKGVKCVTCRSSGRLDFKRKQRWSMVNDYLLAAQERRGQKPNAMGLESFTSYWLVRYYRFLEVLRSTDRHIVAGIDFGFRPSDNRATEPFKQEEDHVEDHPPDDIEDVQG